MMRLLLLCTGILAAGTLSWWLLARLSTPLETASLRLLGAQLDEGDPATVCVDAGDTYLDAGNSTIMALQNGGDGPLELRLAYVSCTCLNEVMVDAMRLHVGGQHARIAAGQVGQLKIHWKPDRSEVDVAQLPKNGRLAVVLTTNDTLHHAIRIEVTTRLLAR